MSGLFAGFTIADVAINTTTKTIAQVLAPTNQRIAINGFHIGKDGSTATKLRLAIQTDAGTTTSGTPALVGPGSETPQGVWVHSATSEPTTTTTLYTWEFSSGFSIQFSRDDRIIIPGGVRYGWIITSAGSENYTFTGFFEE